MQLNLRVVALAAFCSLALSDSTALAQATHTLDTEKSAQMLNTEASKGIALPATTVQASAGSKTVQASTRSKTVQDSVGVTAVMLTQGSVARLFGKEIANTYAAVQLTISNKNPDSAFVLHSVFIDTSQWALGGGSKGFATQGTGNTSRAGTYPNQIASAEARIARGQLLDAQQWSSRNWTVRLLTLAGSLAAGYSFGFKETGIAKGIAAFNGTFVPGVAIAWPDGAVAQLNRISDFGYQTNKVVGKDTGDIVVCFFPIDMFLSAPFRDIFLKSPGLFVSPYQILYSDLNKKYLRMMNASDDLITNMRKLHPCYSKKFEPKQTADPQQNPLQSIADDAIQKTCAALLAGTPPKGDTLTPEAIAEAVVGLDFIGRFGVQNIGVYVDGIMTVDIDTVPASIDQITFDGDSSKPDFWAAAGAKTGSVQCRFCEGGQITIAEADKLGITDLKTTPGDDTQHLKFSLNLTKPVETGQTLTFGITKKSSDPKKAATEIKSSAFTYTVGYAVVTPVIKDVTVKDGKVTVTGTGFFNTKTNPLTAFLRSDTPKEKDVPVTVPSTSATDTLTFDVPASLPAGCWNVHVKLNEMDAAGPNQPSSKILSAAKPALTAATREKSSISVTGTDLVDTSKCEGTALKFQLLKTGTTTPVDVKDTNLSPTGVTLTLPADAATGTWTVEVLQGAKVAGSTPLK